jgi:(p)ppGpp synthase/HD superfamily hydrolase
MAIDVILALTEELDHYTPCRQDKDFYRMRVLIGKIMRNTHNRHSKYQQQQMLEALRFAAKRHKGVYRKNGLTPYILHVLKLLVFLLIFMFTISKSLLLRLSMKWSELGW